MISENQSAVMKRRKTFLHTLSIILDIINASNELNKTLIELIGILSFMLCKSWDMETNSFT